MESIQELKEEIDLLQKIRESQGNFIDHLCEEKHRLGTEIDMLEHRIRQKDELISKLYEKIDYFEKKKKNMRYRRGYCFGPCTEETTNGN